MKIIINAFVVASCLGIGSSMAQIDSPHNYKRPVVSQKQKPQIGLTLPLEVLQNNVAAGSNYKRQNNQNVVSGSAIVLNAPVLQAPAFNPLLLPNHYKIHARPLMGTDAYAQKQPVRYNFQRPDTLSK